MARRRWKWLLLLLALIPLFALGYDRLLMIQWVGSTDLEIEFAVADAGSARPISGAQVEVQSEGGFKEERDKNEFTLTTDSSGRAHKLCRNSMCFGTQSGLFFTDTFVVHLPWWRFRVIAAGYEASDLFLLDRLEYRRQVQEVGPGRAKLVVSVSLLKRSVEQSAVADQPRE